ncbi:MAG TPA: ribosome silencing factor [Nitrospiria bacterium]
MRPTHPEERFLSGGGAATVDSKQKSLLAAQAALDKKAADVVIFAVGGLTSVADYFLLCSAESQPQVLAIRNHIDKTLAKHGCHPFGSEGEAVGRWVLMDYSDVVIHIFQEEVRKFYALERLWGDAPRLEPEEAPLPAVAAGSRRAAAAKGGRRLHAKKG